MTDIDLVKLKDSIKKSHNGKDYYAPILTWKEMSALIEQLEAAQRERDLLTAQLSVAAERAALNYDRATAAEAELKRRDEQEPVGEVIEMSSGPVMDGAVHLNSNRYREIKGQRDMKRMPVGTKFYAASPAAVNSPVIPDGWNLSPDNPTQRMLAAGYQAYMKGPHNGRFYRTYIAMLKAAPQPQIEQQNIPE